jgi:glycosyltransferase involved in cell wall biosynthesis
VLKDRLQEQVKSLGLGGRVHLIGHIAQPERLIADADVFVMSSQEEGLGTAVQEAMALGIPIASTSAGGLPEMLNRGAGLLVSPRDPVALAEAVIRILDEPELARALAVRAGEEVLRFTDRRMAEEVRSVYRSFAHSLDGS